MYAEFETTSDQAARAALIGVRVNLSEDKDRRVPETHDLTHCPTCEDGRLTIEYPRRCRECVKVGF